MIKILRSYLKQFEEIFYMLFFLPLAGCVAMGISSSQMLYRFVFGIAFLFLLLKFFVTDYNKKELLFMSATMALLGYVFYRTREKALIITALSIFGCKDVDVRKVLKYTVVVYIIGMGLTISLVLLGKIPSQLHPLNKKGIVYLINDYGFSHPNSAYSHILMIALMIVAVWQERLRWYHYGVITIAMFFAYKVFFSRTGFLIYLLLCMLLVLHYIIKEDKMKRAFLFLWNFLPIGMAVFSYTLSVLYQRHIWFIDRLNELVSNRIKFSAKALESSGLSWFGVIVKKDYDYYIDNAYINILLSCGICVSVLCILSYSLTIFQYWKINNYFVVILLGLIAIYAFMEYSPINATWNPLLLFLSGSLFGMMVNQKALL